MLFISFSALESSLNMLVAEAINNRSHDLGYQVIKSLTYQNKVKLAKDLYLNQLSFVSKKQLKERYKREFDIIYKKLLELGQFRNKVAHANWVTLDKNGYVRTKIDLDDSGTIQFIKVKITPQMMQKFTNQCHIFSCRIDKFLNKFY